MKLLINLILAIMVIYFAFDIWQIGLTAKTVMHQIVGSMAMIKVLLVGVIIVVFNNKTQPVNEVNKTGDSDIAKTNRDNVYAKLDKNNSSVGDITPSKQNEETSDKERQYIAVALIIVLVMGVSTLT